MLKSTVLIFFSVLILLTGLRFFREPLVNTISWSSIIADENGDLLRVTLSQDEKYRIYTRLSDFPKAVIDMILFKEDRFFYMHWGVNPISILRAALTTYGFGGRRLGGSTISMQLARLLKKSSSKSLTGKIKQLGGALWLEILYSKDEILEAYLNLLPYGANIEGLGTASLVYFEKKPTRLNSTEILTLAVIPQSPKNRSLGLQGNLVGPHQLMKARSSLLNRLVQGGLVSEQDHLNFQVPFRMKGLKDLPFLAPHFVEDVLTDPRRAGVESLTTLNRGVQFLIEKKITRYVDRHRALGVENATALLLDWTRDEIKAVVGSKDYFNDRISGQVNGTKSYRSPGSTLKPLAYVLAMDQGLIHGSSLLKDAPAFYAGFDPENFDREFEGPISADQALIRSRNLPAVQVVSELKNPDFYQFLLDQGIQNMKPPEHYGFSTILGGLEVTMEDLVKMYAMIPNLGERRSLRKLKTDPIKTEGRHFSPEASFLILDILKKMPRPSTSGGSPWSKDNLEVYWKTGTSQGFRDAWTIGIAGQYVLAVWVGNFDGKSNPAFVGKDIAAPLFFEIIDGLKSTEHLQNLIRPSKDFNVKKVQVCALSGAVPGPHCRHTKETWFIPGKSPISNCEIHREIMIDPRTGKRLCNQLALNGKKQVFEFWPTDLLKIFKLAGMARLNPPPWDPRCLVKDLATEGIPPKIISPKKNLVYSIRALGEANREIAFSAIVDADVRETYWFVNESFIGKSISGQDIFWSAKSGSHQVRVVDDQGRSDRQSLVVEVVN